MCPACITTAALVAAGTSGAGVVAVTVRKWRTLLGWFHRYGRDVGAVRHVK